MNILLAYPKINAKIRQMYLIQLQSIDKELQIIS